MRRPRRPARLTLAAAALLAAGALAACGGGGVDLGTGVAAGGTGQMGGTGGTGASQAGSPLVGRWWRLFTFASQGAARTSETFWTFNADGSARRTLITTNVTDGVADVVAYTARWRQIGTEVEVTYLSPVQGTVRFLWAIERGGGADVLYLDDTWFQRLP